MRLSKKLVKNSRFINLILLFSLINFLFPQITHGQNSKINVLEGSQLKNLILINPNPIQLERTTTRRSFPISPNKKPKKTFYLTVTAYSSTVDQCDGDPFTTASGKKVRDGIIAYNYLPFGTKVRFPEVFPNKTFVVQDRLNARAGKYLADIWMPTREEALKWGAKTIKIEIL